MLCLVNQKPAHIQYGEAFGDRLVVGKSKTHSWPGCHNLMQQRLQSESGAAEMLQAIFTSIFRLFSTNMYSVTLLKP